LPCKLGAIDAGLAERLERWREVALRQPTAVVVDDQRVVEVGRLWKPQQFLQKALGWSRRAKVLAAHHQIHCRCCVVDDAGQMI
jgi:hypothetical protein